MKKYQSMKKSFQKGFTLVELGIVVVVAAVILSVVLPKVGEVFGGAKTNGELQELPDVIAKIQKIYSNAPSYAGATLQTVADMGAFPASRIVVANPASVTNRWGGAVTLAVSTITTANDTVNLSHTNIPAQACIDVISQLGNSMGGIRIITVGGVTVKADGANVDNALLATNCNAGGAANTVVYRFSK